MEMKDLCAGLLVRATDYSGFKIVITLGASRSPGKVRCCTWSDNSRAWSNVHTKRADRLEPMGDIAKLRAGQRAAVKHAIDDVTEARGWVRTPAGAYVVGKVRQ
jgi:hypothetical protein